MTRGRDFLVGLVIIVAVALGVLGTLWLEGRTFGPIVTMDVLTESVGQLGAGNAVQYRGVRIGYVQSITVLPDGSGVRVTFVLDSEASLPGDPAVLFIPESLFGAWQAEIVSRATYPDYPFYELPTGGVTEVPVLAGYALPELSRLSRTAEQIATNIASLSNRLELAFGDTTAAKFSSAIDNIEAMTRDLRTFVAEQSEVASTITASADTALTAIEAAAQSARNTFERVDRSLETGRVDSILDNVSVASRGLRDVVAMLSDSTSGLGVTLEHADSTFVRLDRIAARVESGQGSIGRLFGDSTFAVRAEDVLEQMELLLQDLRENPRRYVRLSIF